MTMLVSWWRDEYDMTGAKKLFFSQYLYSLFPRMIVQILAMCGCMSDFRFTVRHNIEGVALGAPLDISCL